MTIVRRRWILAVTVTILLFAAIVLLRPVDTTADYPIKRLLRYSFTVKNPTGDFIKEAEFWTYAPVKLTAAQSFLTMEASTAYRLEADDLGNQRLYFTVKNLPPFGMRSVSIQVRLDLSDDPNRIDTGVAEQFLGVEKHIEIDHPQIKQKADELRSEDSLQTAQSIFDWVSGNLKDAGYTRNDRGALYALQHKSGDCTEHMYLLIALSRASGIPARGIVGFVHAENAVLHPGDYHNWVEVLLDGVWRVVDPYYKVFMDKPSHYIAMRVLSTSQDDSKIESQRLFLANNKIQVEMN